MHVKDATGTEQNVTL